MGKKQGKKNVSEYNYQLCSSDKAYSLLQSLAC